MRKTAKRRRRRPLVRPSYGGMEAAILTAAALVVDGSQVLYIRSRFADHRAAHIPVEILALEVLLPIIAAVYVVRWLRIRHRAVAGRRAQAVGRAGETTRRPS